jgi:hypothetical protein
MIQFLRGTLAMASVVVTLLFLRSFRDSKDRLFAAFAGAFAIFAVHWTLLAFANPADERLHPAFVMRALGFTLIVIAIVDKNRSRA